MPRRAPAPPRAMPEFSMSSFPASGIRWPPPGPQPPAEMEPTQAQAIVHCAMWISFHGSELEETIRRKKTDTSLWAFLFNLGSKARLDVQYYQRRLRFEKVLLGSRQALLDSPLACAFLPGHPTLTTTFSSSGAAACVAFHTLQCRRSS